MKIEYYPIHGRGSAGDKFQLARIQDENGDLHKGKFDQARHFGSEAELRQYLSGVLGLDESGIHLSRMSL